MPLKIPIIGNRLLATGQTTAYHVGDDGDMEQGGTREYEILTAGAYSGNSNLDVAHYAAATISFSAPDIIADSANGLVTFLNADTIVIKGSTSNDGVYTIASGGAAADHFHVTPNVVNEAAGAYVSMYKRAAHSNSCVLDKRTGLMWSRYTSNAEKVGPASDGKLNWNDAATTFTIHPAAADLQMVAPRTIKIVGGAAELTRYHVGDLIDCAGFANAANNLPGYYVTAVAVNGADLDITLDVQNNVLVSEAAAGARSIGLVCRSAFAYAAAARAAGLSGFSDWRIPNLISFTTLMLFQAPISGPDTTAFPAGTGWASVTIWSSTTRVDGITSANRINTYTGVSSAQLKTTANSEIAAIAR